MKPVPKPRQSIRQQKGQQHSVDNNEINNNHNNQFDNNNNKTNNKPGVVVGIASKFDNLTRAGGGAPREISRTFVISREQQNAQQQQEQFAKIILTHFLSEKMSAKIKQQNQQQIDKRLNSCGSDIRSDSKTDVIYNIARHLDSYSNPSNIVALIETTDKINNNNINDNKINNNGYLDENNNNDFDNSTRTDVSLRPRGRRAGGQSASCRVRVQPRCREAQSELHCSAHPQKTTNSWPQQQQKGDGYGSSIIEAMGPSLLERIVTAHPIWFLPQLGRSAAVRLLAGQPIGVFLVRGTSQVSSDSDGVGSMPGRGIRAMALSVCLPSEEAAEAGAKATQLVEHYVIESLAFDGGGVRLKGSSFRFRSLPLLLLHYCQHSEELRSRLRLPPAVDDCTSLRDLQAVARQGREFWVSETAGRTTTNALSQQRQQQQVERQQTLVEKSKYCQLQQNQQQQQFPIDNNNNNIDNCCDIVRDNDNERDNCGVMIENDKMIGTWPEQQQQKQQQVKQHMPTTTNLQKRMPAIVMHNPITTMAAQQQQRCCCCNYGSQNDNYYVVPPVGANNNLTSQQQQQQQTVLQTITGKSKRAVVRTVARPTASGQSCWYVDRAGTKPTVNSQQQQRRQQQPLMSQCVQEPVTSSKASGDYQANAQQMRNPGSLKKSQSAIENIDYYSYESPPASVSSQASSVRSVTAATSGKAPKRSAGGGFLKSLFYASNSNLHRAANKGALRNRSPLDADDYFMPPQSDVDALRDGSLTRRAKTLARRILPSFASNAPTAAFAAAAAERSRKWAERSSKDDSTNIRLVSAEAITARQLAFRRRNTDLSVASLRSPDSGFHYDNNNNNKPMIIHDNKNRPDGGVTVAWRGNGGGGPPIVPPAGRMDKRAVQRCIDELQRQESVDRAIEQSTEDRNSTPQRAVTVVLRQNPSRNNNNDKNYSNNNDEHRRSVSDLADGESDTIATGDVAATKVTFDKTAAAHLRSTAPEPSERTVVIVDEWLIDKHIHNEPATSESYNIVECVNNENTLLDTTTEMKAPVIVRSQIASAAHEHQKTEMVDVEYFDPSAPPPAVFRHSTRLARFSAQPGNRNSKIATVRPQQHMIVNSNESSESGSPPETIKRRLRRFSSNSTQSQSPSVGGLKKGEKIESMKKSTTTIKNVASDVLRRQSPDARTPPTSLLTSSVFHTANDEEDGVCSPSSTIGRRDYAQIGELQQYFASDEYEPTEERTPTKSITSANNLGQSFDNNEDDTISVAGTDFNEPWDSNAWCNLLDLARFGDEKPTSAQAIKALYSAETIFEEENLSSLEELTLRTHLQHHPHSDYFFEEELTSNVASEDRFGSLPRSLYNGGSARGGSATGACARRQPQPAARHLNASYQLQQYLNIIPERESGEFGGTSAASDNGRNHRVSGGTLRSQRASVDAGASSAQLQQQQGESKPTSTTDRPASGSGVNVEMEAAAMAAVLGSCGARPQLGAAYTPEDDGRVPAAAKLSRSVDDHAWHHNNSLHNRTFRYVAPAADENRPQKNSVAVSPMNNNDSFNNNERNGDGSFVSPVGPQPQRMKMAGGRLPPHRLKSSSSFSTPLGASTAANRPSATSVTASTLRVGGGSIGDTSSLFTTHSYGRNCGGGELTRDTQSLHRMPHNDDHLHTSLNNLSVRLTAMSPIIAPARFRNAQPPDVVEPSVILQRFVEQLASDETTLFGGTLHKFIECTVESEETDPHVVIRRVRQFLNGMKNYLVKNGQGGLHALIERESAKLNANEFLNIDVIFETVLTKIVLVPIKGHLYHLMVFENTRNGDLQRLSENLSAVRAMDPIELGFPVGTVMPDAQTMEQVRGYMRRMQNHYSPLKKLENLLKALSLAVTRSLAALSSDSRSIGQGDGYAPPMRSQSGDLLMDFGVGGGGTLDSRASSSAYRQLPHGTPLAGARHADRRPSSAEHFLRSSNKHQSTERLAARVDASGAVTLSTMAKRLPSEELIRWMVYLLAKSSAINCEIEAWYMWELLPQQIVTNGEAEYYLSIFFTAVNMLKKPESIRRLKRQSRMAGGGEASGLSGGGLSTLPEDGCGSASYSSDAFLRIAVPNEHEGSISYHIFPVLPQMNVAKLCRVIAHQFAVTNSEDYGLYVLYDNFETILLPKEFPHSIHDRLIEERKMHLFVYKRRETRIAWPKNAYACCMPAGDEEESLLAQ